MCHYSQINRLEVLFSLNVHTNLPALKGCSYLYKQPERYRFRRLQSNSVIMNSEIKSKFDVYRCTSHNLVHNQFTTQISRQTPNMAEVFCLELPVKCRCYVPCQLKYIYDNSC